MSWLNAVAGLAGTFYQNSANQASAEASMAFQKQVLQNRNQWAVEDLKKAGLNPILAAGATQSSASGAQASNENPVDSAMSSASQANAMKIAKQQQENQNKITEAQVNKANAEAATELEKAEDYRAKRDLYGQTGDMYMSSAEFNRANVNFLGTRSAQIENEIEIGKAQIAKMEKERELLVEQVKTASTERARNLAQASLYRADAALAGERAKLTQAEKAGVEVNTRLKELQVPKSKTKAKLWGIGDWATDYVHDNHRKSGGSYDYHYVR